MFKCRGTDRVAGSERRPNALSDWTEKIKIAIALHSALGRKTMEFTMTGCQWRSSQSHPLHFVRDKHWHRGASNSDAMLQLMHQRPIAGGQDMGWRLGDKHMLKPALIVAATRRKRRCRESSSIRFADGRFARKRCSSQRQALR